MKKLGILSIVVAGLALLVTGCTPESTPAPNAGGNPPIQTKKGDGKSGGGAVAPVHTQGVPPGTKPGIPK